MARDARAEIIARAHREGFEQAGIVRVADFGPLPGERFGAFLDQGRQGAMQWLEAKADWRKHPRALWPEAKSIVMLGLNYGPERNPLEALAHKDRGAISVYTQGRDYHRVVKKKLKSLGGWIAAEFDCAVKVFVDTAPVLEKPLAMQAGLGWQGKHTNLVSREFGSWLFLGSVFTALDLAPDAPSGDHCGQCRACLDICPTKAFPAPYELDARRCISYLTIEEPGIIPLEFRAAMGNRIYGCDDCLAVCPWNKFAQAARELDFAARPELDLPLLLDLAGLDDAAFRARFATTAMKRLGRDRFIRNVCIALGNSGAASAIPVLKDLSADPAPPIRAMAAWALKQLMPPADYAAFAALRRAEEPDAAVKAELA